jgi:transposase InsO family protein
LTPELIQNIVTIRQSEGLGARRIRSELLFQHEIQVSQTAIQRALQRQNVKPLKHARAKHVHKRYSATFPGERMQMDTMKIASGKYQYTLIDDFSRFVYAEIYPSKSAHNTLEFLDFVNDSLVYPIVCLQTDNGTEFTADCVLNYLQESCIKWRPITPGKPHLNGKVERVQRTIWEELYSHLNLKTTNLSEELGDYLMRYNYRRIHGVLGKTPAEREHEHLSDAPTSLAVQRSFDPLRERQIIRSRNINRLRHLLK